MCLGLSLDTLRDAEILNRFDSAWKKFYVERRAVRQGVPLAGSVETLRLLQQVISPTVLCSSGAWTMTF